MNPRDRLSLGILQGGALLVVLAAVPYKLFDLDRFFVPKELVLAGVMLLLAVFAIARTRSFSLRRADELLAASVLLTVASGAFATNHWLAERAIAVTLGGATCYWCARRLARTEDLFALVSVLAFAGVLGAITSLLQAYGVQTELFSLNRAPGGTFGNRNFMAHLGAITLPAIMFCGVRARSSRRTSFWCAGTALVGAALMLSRTRAAWLALIAGFAVFLIGSAIALRQRDDTMKLSRLWLLIGALVAGPAASLVLPNTLDWRSDSPYMETAQGLVNYKGGSGHGRLVQYGNSLKMSLRHPLLGVGPGNWAVIYPHFASENDPSLTSDGLAANPWPSSDWVAFISERGVPAAALLGLALLVLFVNGVQGLFRETSSEARLASAVFLATLVTLMIVGMFDAVLLLPAPTLIGWSLLGALSPHAESRRIVPLGTAARWTVVAIVGLAGGGAVARSGAEIGAMSLFNSSTKLATLERASTLDPGSYRIHVRLADAYEKRGDCRKARPHASAAKALFPYSPIARRLAASCGG